MVGVGVAGSTSRSEDCTFGIRVYISLPMLAGNWGDGECQVREDTDQEVMLGRFPFHNWPVCVGVQEVGWGRAGVQH